jgi:anti-sigma B factor antagonist
MSEESWSVAGEAREVILRFPLAPGDPPNYVFFMDSENRRLGNVSVFKPSIRKLDVLTSNNFADALQTNIADGAKLVLDLSAIEFIDSSGLGKIIGALRSFRDRGGDIRICGAQPTVSILFDMVRLGEIVGIDADAETAAAELSRTDGPSGSRA